MALACATCMCDAGVYTPPCLLGEVGRDEAGRTVAHIFEVLSACVLAPFCKLSPACLSLHLHLSYSLPPFRGCAPKSAVPSAAQLGLTGLAGARLFSMWSTCPPLPVRCACQKRSLSYGDPRGCDGMFDVGGESALINPPKIPLGPRGGHRYAAVRRRLRLEVLRGPRERIPARRGGQHACLVEATLLRAPAILDLLGEAYGRAAEEALPSIEVQGRGVAAAAQRHVCTHRALRPCRCGGRLALPFCVFLSPFSRGGRGGSRGRALPPSAVCCSLLFSFWGAYAHCCRRLGYARCGARAARGLQRQRRLSRCALSGTQTHTHSYRHTSLSMFI